MKNSKAIAWLLLATAVTAALHVFLSFKVGVTASLVQRSALLESPFDKATRITVTRRGEAAATLERVYGSWRLVSPYPALADDRVVMRLLDALSISRIDDTLGGQEFLRLGRSLDDFGLAEPEIRVSAVSGGDVCEIDIGGFTPSGDGVYAAIANENAVYVVSSNVFAAANLPPDGFRRRSVFPVLGAAVQSFDLKRGSGSFMRFVREGETWKMREPKPSSANAKKVASFLSAAADANAAEFVWPVGAKGESMSATASLLAGYGLDPESAVTLTLRCADGTERQASFGKEAKNGRVYALVHGSGAIVTVDASLKDMALAGVAEFTDTRLFPLEVKAVTRFSVQDGGASYIVARDESGSWRLDAPVVAPVDERSVSVLLDRVLALNSADLDPSGPSVSVASSTESFAVSRKALLGDMRLEDLRSREILKVDPSSVRRIVVSVSGGRPAAVVYDRDRRAWNVESSQTQGSVSAEAVENVLSALNPLKAELIAKLKVSASDLKKYGLETPRITVAVDLEREGAARRNLLIGDSARRGLYATLGATDAVFVISADTARKLSGELVVADGPTGTSEQNTRKIK